MVTLVEDFPSEIWILIFRYLEAHDLFRAFTKLNNHFDRLLSSKYLRLKIQFNEKNRSNLISIIYCSAKTTFNRACSLQWIDKRQYDYLPQLMQKNLSELIRLESLKIEIHPRQTTLICQVLPELYSLKNVSIKSKHIQSFLVQTLLTHPSLNRCELISSSTISTAECILNNPSNIEILHLTEMCIVLRPTTNSFDDYLPRLTDFQICGSMKTFKNLSRWILNEIVTFGRIPLTTMKSKSNRSMMIFFDYFQLVLSFIKHLSLQIYIDIQDEILLEYLTNHWWTDIEQIEQLHISIQISKQINETDVETQQRFSNYANKLSSKKKESSQFYWKQSECPIDQFIVQISTTD